MFDNGFKKEAIEAKKETSSEAERALKADLVILPKNVPGTNCGNCRFVQKDTCEPGLFCTHPKVKMHVTAKMCCKFWDAEGTDRSLQKGNPKKQAD